MRPLVVVENLKRWPLDLPGADVVSARAYLTEPSYSAMRGPTVFNLCRTYGYQTLGYYVSLLAAARGHRPLPSVATIQDLRLSPLLRIVSEEIDELVQRSLGRLRSKRFELSIYFGRNVSTRYDRLAQALFNQYPAPFLRATFVRDADDEWRLQAIRPIATSEIRDPHREFVIARAREYFARASHARTARRRYRYELAILTNEEEVEPPSDERALARFAKAARSLGMEPTFIDADDYGRIAEFDALFIRETTAVDHHTYRFARRAAAEELVVVDDPESIVRCTNKVFQAEAFARAGIDAPRTVVAHAGNVAEIEAAIGLPCVLKRPDSSFSQGVVKATTRDELARHLAEFLERSDLVVAQEWTPSQFDWRIGVLDRRPLYACRYHMARGHWQIIRTEQDGARQDGEVETVPLAAVPGRVVRAALRAAALMGSGLYGVDLKELGGRVVVMEVNDNPSIEAGYEDRVLGDELYRAVMLYFRNRLDARGAVEYRT